MSIDNKIKELGFELPNAADPVGSYVAAKIVGKLLYISGQISIDKNGKLIKVKKEKIIHNNIIIFVFLCTIYILTSKF